MITLVVHVKLPVLPILAFTGGFVLASVAVLRLQKRS